MRFWSYLFMLAVLAGGCDRDNGSGDGGGGSHEMVISSRDVSAPPAEFFYGIEGRTTINCEPDSTGRWSFPDCNWDYYTRVQIEPPGQCPLHEHFPEATRAQHYTWSDEEGTHGYQFEKITSHGIWNLGRVYCDEWDTLAYGHATQTAEFPLQISTEWTVVVWDSSEYYYSVDSIRFTVDASGYVNTPYDTYRCLRLIAVDRYTEWDPFGNVETDSYCTVTWLDAHGDIVAQMAAYGEDLPTQGALALRVPSQAIVQRGEGRKAAQGEGRMHGFRLWSTLLSGSRPVAK